MKPFAKFACRNFAVAVLSLASVTASAIPFGTEIGSNGGPAFTDAFKMSSAPFLGHIGWVIGSPAVPAGLVADPYSGPWRKYLYTDLPGNPFNVSQGFIFNVVEVLWAVNSWDSWHEGIATDGWEWVPNFSAMMTASSFQFALDNGTSPILVDGLTVDRSVNGKLLSFEFDPLVTTNSSDTLVVFKQIACTSINGCVLGSSPNTAIEVWEFPTSAAAPAPSTLALLGIGLFGMCVRCRRAD